MNVKCNIDLRPDDNPNARDTLSFKFKCQVKFFTQAVNDTEAVSAGESRGKSARWEGWEISTELVERVQKAT